MQATNYPDILAIWSDSSSAGSYSSGSSSDTSTESSSDEDDCMADRFFLECYETGDSVVCLQDNLYTCTAVVCKVDERTAGPSKVKLAVMDPGGPSSLWRHYEIEVNEGDPFNVSTGTSEEERAIKRQRPNVNHALLGMSPGARYSDRLAKYEAFMDFEIAGIVETTRLGLKTRKGFYTRNLSA